MSEKVEQEPEPGEPMSAPKAEDDYQAASQSTANYANYEDPKKAPNPIWRKLGITAAVLVLIAALGAGGWYFKNHKSTKKPAATSQTSQTATSQPAASQIDTTTKHYSSSSFQLTIDYPQDWVVNDTGGGSMTVTSPKLQLKNAAGQAVSGLIVFTIRDKAQKLPEFDAGNATALRDSEKVAYTKPNQTQRGNTYLSFLRYAHSTSTGLDAVFITGDSGYTKDQAIPKVDIQKVDPIINLSFGKCTDNACTATTPLSISATAWDDKTFSTPLENLLKSLSIS